MSPPRIDWCQVWYPGPKRAFTADEMARAGSDAPSPTLVAIAGVNFATVSFVVLQVMPAEHTARLTGVLVALAVMGTQAARWLWWRPWRWPLMQVSLVLTAAMSGLSLGIKWRLPRPGVAFPLIVTNTVGTAVLVTLLWFLVVWRSHAIEARLREQAEREKAMEMARRLAAAQLEPHFLFNTLASLQHWVQTQDERAAPLLASLTGYLRATLPLFKRPLLAAGDELLAVQRYLEVMQSRMGARLQWQAEFDGDAAGALLPPGLLLTLVENAVVHGVEMRIGGGRIAVQGRREGGQIRFEVIDDGAGPPPELREGVGLGNLRQRLALAFGEAARLHIGHAPGGGCKAELTLPFLGGEA